MYKMFASTNDDGSILAILFSSLFILYSSSFALAPLSHLFLVVVVVSALVTPLHTRTHMYTYISSNAHTFSTFVFFFFLSFFGSDTLAKSEDR
ncbi:hypothetical protein TSAR_012026 [Trichomalopsis sarcophagae]|uniref:Uncharacterized protein n=1 Tax=Trichomalopsis sarcophagae TaxID=543379 RepID=A0A232F802_9HYME|nr:hypothetical protein TSAR_012026 [Trichomalopsis sarcophagae]